MADEAVFLSNVSMSKAICAAPTRFFLPPIRRHFAFLDQTWSIPHFSLTYDFYPVFLCEIQFSLQCSLSLTSILETH